MQRCVAANRLPDCKKRQLYHKPSALRADRGSPMRSTCRVGCGAAEWSGALLPPEAQLVVYNPSRNADLITGAQVNFLGKGEEHQRP